MNNKVKTLKEAHKVFDLLGVKNVTKRWQHKKGTHVFELPFKTMYYNGHGSINRFTIYRNGYIRKMIVNDDTNASYGCYQLNLVRKVPKFVKDYEWNDDSPQLTTWTGKYRKVYNNERIMIDNHRDRMIYLCNYILKNYYRSQTGASFYRVNDYQVSLMRKNQEDSCKLNRIERPEMHKLPFDDKPVYTDEIKVIINGQRYNLS